MCLLFVFGRWQHTLWKINKHWKRESTWNFQVLSPHFFKVVELLNEDWAKFVQSEIFQLQSMLNAIRFINQRFCVQEFWNFVSGLDIQLEQSENNNAVCKQIICRLWNTTSHIPFFFGELIWTYGSEVKVCRRESVDLGSIPAGWGNSIAPPPFCLAMSPSVHWLSWGGSVWSVSLKKSLTRPLCLFILKESG